MPEGYLAPTGFGQAEFTERRSRFIGRVWLTETEDEALARLKETREAHWDATHNVYAYRLRENGVMRYSDDGEPQGTAGQPTLAVLRGAEVYNVCCVVTRYFGGILLGTGGLVRAYTRAAQLALTAAGLSEVRLWETLLAACSYALYERVRKTMEDQGAVLVRTDFGADVTIEALAVKGAAARVNAALRECSGGAVEAIVLEERCRSVPLERAT